MNISKALAKYVGGELAETAGKNATKSAVSKLSNLLPGATAKAGEKTLSTLSKVGEQLPAVAQKADDLIDVDTTKALNNTMDKYGASDGGGKIPEASSGATNDDMTTLYRGLTQKYDPNYPVAKLDTSGYESWTDNIDLAKKYGNNVYSIEVPKSDIKTSYLDEDPMSPTYGDRNPIYSIDKKAGLDGVSGNEYLLEVGSDYQKGLEYIPVELPNKTAKINNTELDVNTAKSLDDAMSKYGAMQKNQRLAPAQDTNPMDEDTLDLIQTLRDAGATVDDNGMVTLYHRTSPENAENIYRTGKMYGKENDGALFFSTNENAQPAYGSSVVKVKMPANKLQLDDIFDNNADVKYITGQPNKMEDMSSYLVANEGGGVPAEIINKTKTYLEPAKELGKDLKSVASAMRAYKDKNMLNMADNMIDAYDESNFDWAAIRRRGEQAITNLLGEENLKNLKVLVEPVVNNASRKGEHEVNKLVAANFLKSNDSDDIVKLSRELLPVGEKIYRRGDKSGINWTTSRKLAESDKYDGELLEHTLTENDRYIAPEIIDILQRTLENEHQVIFKLGK